MTFVSHASDEFWELHPSLRLKPVGQVWSARVNKAYRVLAYREGQVFYWFWIGSHKEHERVLGR